MRNILGTILFIHLPFSFVVVAFSSHLLLTRKPLSSSIRQTEEATAENVIVQSQIEEYLTIHNQRQIENYLREREQQQPQQQKSQDDSKNLIQTIKDSGAAGIVSFALVQSAFWALSIPICVFGFYKVTGHWPDISDSDDMAKLGAEAFTYLNVARLAAPFRIAVSLSLVPWIQTNIIDRFQKQ